MDLTRRGFLKGAGALSASTLLVRQATVFGAEAGENGLFVPKEPEVLIATEMPVEQPIGNFSMYITSFKMTRSMDRIDVTEAFDVTRKYVHGLQDCTVEITGYVTRQMVFESVPMAGKKVMVHMTQA